MPIVHPFSKIDVLFKDENLRSGCLIDSNLLIAMTSLEGHPFNEDAEFIFEKLAHCHVPLFVTHTVKTEFLDLTRRRIITDTLMDILSDSKVKLSHRVRSELKRHQTWITTQIERDDLPILPDQRIKTAKQIFDPRTQSGQLGWLGLCKRFLGAELLKHWDGVCERLALNYAAKAQRPFSKETSSGRKCTEFRKRLRFRRMIR
jgi:hypothetical protein